MSRKGKSAGRKILPREALNRGVTITLSAMVPVKNGRNDQALCSVPLSRKAGVCQRPQITPMTSAAHIGVILRCRRGSARPRQPNSSMGPLIAIKKSATRNEDADGNGKAVSERLPFKNDPTKNTRGTPRSRNAYQGHEQRHSRARPKCRRNPSSPDHRKITINAEIAGAQTAR